MDDASTPRTEEPIPGPDTDALTRRGFMTAAAAAGARILLAAAGLHGLAAPLSGGQRAASGSPAGSRDSGTHPEPRPGIDASNVLGADDLSDAPHVIPVFDAVRDIPHIADGLRCYCGCAGLAGYRSLLSCYEGAGMARYCDMCQAQATLAHNRWTEGQTLEQIRRATDARFAPAGGEDPADPHCAKP